MKQTDTPKPGDRGGTEADRMVGRNIRRCRLARGYTEVDVAAHLGIVPGSAAAVEAGRLRLSATGLFELALFLRCRVSDFFRAEAGTQK